MQDPPSGVPPSADKQAPINVIAALSGNAKKRDASHRSPLKSNPSKKQREAVTGQTSVSAVPSSYNTCELTEHVDVDLCHHS